MEKMKKDEALEIFEECSNEFPTEQKCKELFTLEHINDQRNAPDFSKYNQGNNNHHVVYVGVIIVLLTVYLGMASVQKYLVNCVENRVEQIKQNKANILSYWEETEKIENTHILERLLEYKDICRDLEIFTKDISIQHIQKGYEDSKEKERNNDENVANDIWKHIEFSSGNIEEDSSIEQDDNIGSSGNGYRDKTNRSKHKKSKYSIKTSNTKNGFNKYNKSTKAKHQKTPKKDSNLNKKNSTAEPIIYLFALIFIYLLLKAASDINQHYKSQNKNDKRLRRCSLQSYAQTHRPDRRASKGITTKGLPKF